MGRQLWTPRSDAATTTEMGRYRSWLAERGLVEGEPDYPALHAWSTADLDRFWTSVWDYFELRGDGDPAPALADPAMPGAVWFPGVSVNYAEHCLVNDRPDDALAVVVNGREDLTWGRLREQVGRARAGLVRLGVTAGDRVAAYLPNSTEALVAFLATASLGAVWSSCAPEFGTRAVLDRFTQIEPKVLLAVDGYRYGDKSVDRRAEVAELRAGLPSLAAVVAVPALHGEVPEGTTGWAELVAEAGDPAFERVPFTHPLYVLYSSGTTGPPKAIVHGHGGMLLQHVKDVGLHFDVQPGDVFFWYSTTGWMMWNKVVAALLRGATVALFDGNPGHPDLGALWRWAAENRVTHFGTSAAFLMSCVAAGQTVVQWPELRFVGSTGSPLPEAGFEWVAANLPGVQLGSVSGGTDVCSAVVGSTPLTPVWSGEISAPFLGVPVAAFDPDGNPVVGVEGEMVLTAPIPAMPVGFWGDEDGSRYRAAYFERYPGAWHQGDWLTVTERGSCRITGRSDATLNRGGVRIGTAEIYAVVEALPSVADSLVVHVDDPATGHGRLVLFVVPATSDADQEALRAEVVKAIRAELSPRHVPDQIVPAPAVPRTLSGKKLEVPVKRILTGADPARVASAGSLSNPDSLDFFVDYRSGTSE